MSKRHEVAKRKAEARLLAASTPAQVKPAKTPRVKGPSGMAPVDDALQSWRANRRRLRKGGYLFTGVYERLEGEVLAHFKGTHPLPLSHVEAVVLGLK